ncbi:cyanophycin synthetase [Collimonas fungivorans]|uniref:Cyanophycin synthetase n=1 Tax=Collimonas fungivorans (strain Ter331) TaxID=1005048 RepID=G0AB32_COLFT|nr:cyanophycin synthetase [Collimonas fungivorans]AEK61157.1 Cyanophycin synthetase [Collimonas fungivorans Ter331]
MKNIEILRIMSLRGPNIWTYRSTLEAWIDIGELEDFPSNTLPGFNQRLTSWLPTLIEHRCSYGERGGFVQRLQDGTWPGHILEHVTLELQNLAGMPGGFGKARSTSVRGVYKVAVRARHEQVTRAALHAARDLVMAAIEDKPFDVPATITELRSMVDSRCLGPSTACIVEAAEERRIPSFRLTEGNLVQLGHGIRQRRIWTAETDQTSAIAESISSDKDLTKSLLQACGVPVPEGQLVESAAEAWEAAEDIGLPVVVKPSDANHGRGVFIDLNTQAEIETAYTLALQEGSSVIVERFIRGNEHRLLIVGGRLAAAARGEPLSISGDGKSTIRQLIDSQINSDPRRGELEECPLSLVLLDDEPVVRVELERQGFNGESIPPAGKQVLIQRNGNVSIDVTDLVHPSVAAAASLAARVVGLDIAGVDLVAEDISRPLEEQRGAIVEVNAGPGLLMHLKPAEGRPRPVGRAIIEHLFAAANNGRIPIVGVTGTHGKTTVSRLIAWQLHLSGNHVGLACGDGLYFAQRQVEKGDRANWESAQRVLINRAVEAAVFENSHDTILSEGLVYDRCQVGVVTNIAAGDSSPQYYINDAEEMVKVTRTQVDVVLPSGVAVLNAADPLVAGMASLCDGEVIFFGLSPTLPVIAEQLEQDKRAVFVRNDQIMLAVGKNEMLLADITTVPLIARSKDRFQVENVLAAVAAAWALDISHDLIRAGIETFEMA